MNLRETLHLPDPDFTIPMKADLPAREPEMQAEWERMDLYGLTQEARKDAPVFVLHDGPPYTNSPIHIGTALNKILKDFVVKSRCMMGYRAPYVPGYDNHGLPIEQTVMKAFHEKGEKPDVVTLRKACREHAAKYIEIQSRQFKRLGIFGLWDQPYATMDFKYEAEIIRVFKRMAEAGYVYKGLRPTLWSPTSRTALADTEIVYKDHTSKAIYVKFPLRDDVNGWSGGLANVSTIIWTTTPWTIPANLAVAFHPAVDYAIVHVGEDRFVVAEPLVGRLAEDLGWSGHSVERVVLGASFEGSKFKHPIFDRDSVAVLADYVTTEDGTGVVHTAPGHGREDFFTGQKYGLPVLCPVDEGGILTQEAGEFAGVSYKDCDVAVVDRLNEVGALLKVSDFTHSYPHAERDDRPVIFRATEQWFVGIDTNDLRERMLQQIEGVQFFPENGRARITAMVANRPDWCISRQRPWGVGIPVVYGAESGVPCLHPDVIESVAQLVEREGSDAWFDRDPSDLLPAGFKHPQTGETTFRKETDVLDVWFDSGCTSLCVLEGHVNPNWKERWPADVYLEGSDQHRGWFNSSLIIGTATRGEAPYRTLVTHGWVTDEEGRKMSKRLMNSLDPETVCGQFGADILRYWVASVKWELDVPCSENLLQKFGDNYRRIRNTLRFLLGNLTGWSPSPAPPSVSADAKTKGGATGPENPSFPTGRDSEAFSAGAKNKEGELLEVDEWVVAQTDLLVADCLQAYERFDFGAVISAIHNFCVKELSSFYLDAIKDRMYCDGKDWATRRSGQAACHHVLTNLCKLLAPLLPHTAEEVWARIPGALGPSVHTQVIEAPTSDRLEEIEACERQSRVAALLEVREEVFAAFEQEKAKGEIKDSQDAVLRLGVDSQTLKTLQSFREDLPNLLKVSWVEISEGEGAAQFERSPYLKCERSRIRRPDVEEVNGVPLCGRCRKVLQELAHTG
ncbi:MAG: isoleucine--tRNA ligase [Armatimonadetes bacterium]|nr:isoleucine--tRNA ligase [Armatimonadota bacterium]